ncbi:MAG TPA: RND transporter [Verrucomicrobiales bacterium]|nr:RND transporter [Verrucomicrobiales bacterium]
MNAPQSSWSVRLLSWLAASVMAHPRRWVWPQLLLFVVAVLFTAMSLEFKMDRNDLVSADDESHRIYLEYIREFPLQNELVVVVESESRERNRQFVERLGARLEAETNLFTDVFYKGDLKLLGDKALLFVPEDDLRAMELQLEEYRPFLANFTEATNLVSFVNLVNRQIRTADRSPEAKNEGLIDALPAIRKILDQAADSLDRPGVPPSPGLAALFSGDEETAEQQMYITFAGGNLYLVTARPRGPAVVNDAVVRLRQLIAETKLEVPGMTVGATGENILEFDEMQQSQRDSTLASVVAFGLCGLIFVFGYRETGRPIKAVFCLLIGLGFTMGYTTLVVGHLNILTITFVPILIGLAIDFGVHLITRYEEELRQGASEETAMRLAIVHTGQGIFSGAFTTAGAFFAMAVTEFKGIREMGLICGGGMLVCLVPMMTLLPVLLMRGRQNRLDHFIDLRQGFTGRLEQFFMRHPALTVLGGAAVTVLAVTQAPRLYFDYNLLNMQSRDLPAVALSRKLIDSDSRSVLFAAVQVETREEAMALYDQFKGLPSVASVNFGGIDEMRTYLTEDQSVKLELVKRIRETIRGIRFQPPDTNAVNLELLSASLYSLGGYMGLAAEAAGPENPALRQELLAVRQSALTLTRAMFDDATPRPADKLAQFQTRLFDDISGTFEAIRRQDAGGPLRIEDLPPALRDRFIGVNGHWLLQIYPRKDVWDRDNQGEFVNELRTVTPAVTGTPVEQWEYTSLLVQSYLEAAVYALIAITFLVAFHFRRPILVMLSLLPVACGTAWTAGVMGWFDLPINPANIMTLPLVVGIGVTNGIHLLNRFVEEGTVSVVSKSTGKAVMVSGLTTIAGFSSLILGKHQGIQSLGLIMSLGVGACMIAALTVLPALLALAGSSRQQRKTQ